jgi:hypothetical protein
MHETRLELAVAETPEPDWQRFGPLGGGAVHLQRALGRLLWLALNPARDFAGLPTGWAHGRFMDSVTLHCGGSTDEVRAALERCFWGKHDEFLTWLGSKFTERVSAFERNAIQADMGILENFGSKLTVETDNQLALL